MRLIARTAVSYRSSGIISAMPTHECGSSRGYGTVVRCGRLAQLVRAPPLHGGCRGFESLIAHFSQRREKSRNRISSRVISTRAPVFCPHSAHVLFVFCRKVHVIAKSPKPNGPGDFRIREKIAKSLGLLALAERAQVNTVPIGADGQRSGGVHAGGLGRGLHGAGACGTGRPGFGVSTHSGPSSPRTA